MLNYYERLGVSKDATNDEINSAFRRNARKFHADSNDGINADALMRELIHIRDTLLDKDKRRQYDATLGNANSKNNTNKEKEDLRRQAEELFREKEAYKWKAEQLKRERDNNIPPNVHVVEKTVVKVVRRGGCISRTISTIVFIFVITLFVLNWVTSRELTREREAEREQERIEYITGIAETYQISFEEAEQKLAEMEKLENAIIGFWRASGDGFPIIFTEDGEFIFYENGVKQTHSFEVVDSNVYIVNEDGDVRTIRASVTSRVNLRFDGDHFTKATLLEATNESIVGKWNRPIAFPIEFDGGSTMIRHEGWRELFFTYVVTNDNMLIVTDKDGNIEFESMIFLIETADEEQLLGRSVLDSLGRKLVDFYHRVE